MGTASFKPLLSLLLLLPLLRLAQTGSSSSSASSSGSDSSGCSGSGGHGSSGHHWYEHDYEYSYVEACTLIILIIIAMLFERVWHSLVHWAEHSYRYGHLHKVVEKSKRESLGSGSRLTTKVAQESHEFLDTHGHLQMEHMCLFKELVDRAGGEFMTLGVLAFATFIFNNAGGFDAMVIHLRDEQITLPRTSTDWLHMVEIVHVKLFVAMMLYFFLIFSVVNSAVLTIKKYEKCRIRRVDLARIQGSTYSKNKVSLEAIDSDLSEYCLWREYFVERVLRWKKRRPELFNDIAECLKINPEDFDVMPRVRKQIENRFAFSQYLAHNVCEGICESIHVHEATWFMLLCLFGVFAIMHRWAKVGLFAFTLLFLGTTMVLLTVMALHVRRERRKIVRFMSSFTNRRRPSAHRDDDSAESPASEQASNICQTLRQLQLASGTASFNSSAVRSGTALFEPSVVASAQEQEQDVKALRVGFADQEVVTTAAMTGPVASESLIPSFHCRTYDPVTGYSDRVPTEEAEALEETPWVVPPPPEAVVLVIEELEVIESPSAKGVAKVPSSAVESQVTSSPSSKAVKFDLAISTSPSLEASHIPSNLALPLGECPQPGEFMRMQSSPNFEDVERECGLSQETFGVDGVDEKSFHEKYSTELYFLRLLQTVLFLFSYVFARTLMDFNDWRSYPETQLLSTSLFTIMMFMLYTFLHQLVPTFLALMSLPPYCDEGNLAYFFAILNDNSNDASAPIEEDAPHHVASAELIQRHTQAAQVEESSQGRGSRRRSITLLFEQLKKLEDKLDDGLKNMAHKQVSEAPVQQGSPVRQPPSPKAFDVS